MRNTMGSIRWFATTSVVDKTEHRHTELAPIARFSAHDFHLRGCRASPSREANQSTKPFKKRIDCSYAGDT